MVSYGSISPGVSKQGGSVAKETAPLVNGSSAPDPIQSASVWSKLIFGWMEPVLDLGNAKQRLDPEDLDEIPLPADCTTTGVMDKFDHYWEDEKRKAAEHEGPGQQNLLQAPSLFRSLAHAFGGEFARAGLLKLVHDLAIFVGPQVLNGLILFFRDADAPMSRGLLLTLAVTLSQLTMSFCLRHYFFKCYVTGLRIRTAIVAEVYRKALVLSSSERQSRTLGEITNLMSIDAQRMQDLTTYLHAVWYSFLQIGLALFFLWQQLGPSCLGGVAVIVITIPLTKTVAQWMGNMQKVLMKVKDDRVEINSEVLSSMKVIKLQAWEESFEKRILHLRDKELRKLLKYIIGISVTMLLWSATPLAVALATFAAYVLSGHELDVASALTALALFDILRFPLFMLPQVINRIVEASVSLKRLNSFLTCKEHEPVGAGDLTDIGVKMVDASYAYESRKPKVDDDDDPKLKELADKDWEVALLRSQLQEAEARIKDLTTVKDMLADEPEGSEAEMEVEHSSLHNLLCLKRINFECKEGEFIAVIGGVGCGKTSFLNAILGELRQLSGTAAEYGNLSFFSQTAFMMNATVRENILFGHVDEVVDEERYQRALTCCSLRHDLQLLPAGDLTPIGERGITLSGGQKARIAMARAVYHSADISLLDDPLAAVDAHVGSSLFQKCIVDELLLNKSNPTGKRRTVILVTNALQYLSSPQVDRIVVFKEGRIAERGTFDELRRGDTIFSRYLAVLAETGVSQTAMEGCEPASPRRGSIGKAARRRSSSKESSIADLDLQGTVPQLETPKKLVEADTTLQDGEEPDQEEKQIDAVLTTDELGERAVGHVDRKVYFAWAKAAGGYWIPFVIVIFYGAAEGVTVLSKWWLTYWSHHAGAESQVRFLTVYALINLAAILAQFARLLLIMVCGLRAARNMFARMLDSVLKAPMSFFDTTPVGRIVNRFSKDIYTLDEQLMMTLRSYLATLFSIFSTIFVITIVTPVFALCLIPLIIFYGMEQNYFTASYRELKRLDSINRSPLYALLGETVDGVATIRSYNAQGTLYSRLGLMLDNQQHAYFLTTSAQCWLAVRLELVGTLVITFACLCSVLQHGTKGGNEAFAGLAGLAISYSLTVTQALNWNVRMASDFEANMVAVERIEQYCHIPSEAPRSTDADKNLPPSWPAAGEIDFVDSKLRYRPGLPLVLKGLNIRIPPRSKVGVVGRTGAGKSTLMVALLRIVELDSGKIIIDGVDTHAIGLAKLRSSIAVIPQDPVLFSGTIRTNLDPFDEYSDARLYDTLARVGLYSATKTSSSSMSLSSLAQNPVQSLDDTVAEGGSNYSVGQRQLVVIARALLHRCSVVIMDEATASVDADTDARIQGVMRTEFAAATCLTMAHRLNTIMDSDYILVMDDGRAAEFDRPQSLLARGGMFKDLVAAAAREGQS